MVINEFRMTFDSRSVNEGFSRATVAAFTAQLDPTVEEINDIKTAVSEAVTNCIVHGYRNTVGKIYIVVKIHNDNRVVITIRDRGCGINDVKKAREPLFSTLGGGHPHACPGRDSKNRRSCQRVLKRGLKQQSGHSQCSSCQRSCDCHRQT